MNPRANPQFPFLYLVIGALVMSGCASMSEEECRSADWRLIGYEDGSAGRSTLRIKQHRENCADHGISPKLDRYLAGHREGLGVYCRPFKAYHLGRAGQDYPAVCPEDLHERLRPAYRNGVRVYHERKKVKQLKQRLQATRRDAEAVERTLTSHQQELVEKGTPEARRLELLAEILSLSKRQEQYQQTVSALEHKIKARRKALSRLETNLAQDYR